MFIKGIVVLVAATAALVAAGGVPIVNQELEVFLNGKYRSEFQSADGIRAAQSGDLKNVNGTEVGVVRGGYEYKGDDGKSYSVKYTADETGYHPVGTHIPVVPEYIKRALEYIKIHSEFIE